MKKALSVMAMALSLSLPALADIAIVVNPANSSDISDDNIKRIFLGKEKRFSDGSETQPVNLKEGASRDQFNEMILGRSSSQVSAYWSKLIFTGKGTPPKEFTTDADILSHIASNKNAIGYVDAASVNDSVKVIKTL
ncbi:phosphate ABC transporter substrate-binding protein [Aestuariibacter sp. AA17]|uniref:Phosphate ABC transporter substrate-binding protein n=1 Tax=Fluctibacter corallii TaxID=2984329 RepID=A0ABT3A437_9ALTE|nr:phosphate ABC transporter substrate-binding protein [Aestuariibacter sp. AA17]MCV2883385.1 phosphate ABC transporter substrate-binding protein [Aestuariibacter sp. AA17]